MPPCPAGLSPIGKRRSSTESSKTVLPGRHVSKLKQPPPGLEVDEEPVGGRAAGPERVPAAAGADRLEELDVLTGL
jgi:hypothetical protein